MEPHIAVELFRIGIGGQSVQVGQVEAIVVALHPDEFAQRSKLPRCRLPVALMPLSTVFFSIHILCWMFS